MSSQITRFVVLSHQRTGSHYVMNLLNSHDDILCRSDFQTQDVLHRGAEWAFSQGFLPDGSASIVGFLVKFRQKLHTQLPADVKVIFLQRDNLLAQFLSKRRSVKLGCYESASVSLSDAVRLREKAPPETISPVDCLRFFERIHKVAQRARLAIDGKHAIVDVTYEQLCEQPALTLRRLHTFLGAKSVAEVRSTQGRGAQKLEQRPLQDSIANYRELRAALSSSRWAHVFD